MNNYDKFIGKLYDILLESDIINYKDKPNDLKEKKGRLEKYLDKLDRVQSKVISKEEHIDTLKNLYYDKYIIKKENIPEGYFKSLEKRYLDEGHGHHNLVNPDNNTDKRLKEEHINVIIREQRDSLDTWLNYFLSKDSDYLPMWAKVWAFQGMLGIGNLNKEKDGYGRRSNTSVNPFVSLDSEILGKCVELVKETFDNKEITDKEVDKLVSSGSFAKLYGKLLANKKQLKVSSNEGIWVKYNYETSEEADKKIKDGIEPEYLKLYNSLQGYNTGWCTAGSKETAKSQICGSSSYIGGDFYVYYTKDKNNEYKIPRIAIRMDKESIGEIRGIAEGQNIESNMDSVLEEKIKEFPNGKLYQKKVHDMKMLTQIYDNNGKRELTKNELKFLYEIDDKISGFGYRNDPRIKEIIEKRDKRTDLTIALDCKPNEIGIGISELFNNKLVYYEGDIDSESYRKLKKLNFDLPEYLSGSLILYLFEPIDELDELVFPKSISDAFYLWLSKPSDDLNLILPKNIGGNFNLIGLKSPRNLILPQNIGHDLILNYFESAEGVILPKNMSGSVDLNNLTSAKGLVLPTTIGGDLYLRSLFSTEGLVLPQSIGGSLYLSGLITAEGLVFPEKIGGDLDLCGLHNGKNLKLPKNIGGDLYLSNLSSLKDLILPETIGGTVTYNKYYIYTLKELKQLQQEEINKESINSNHRGFVTGIFTIIFALFITIFSILISIFIIK